MHTIIGIRFIFVYVLYIVNRRATKTSSPNMVLCTEQEILHIRTSEDRDVISRASMKQLAVARKTLLASFICMHYLDH